MSQIISNPEILGSKPIVAGTRLSVEHILGLLSHGMSNAEIIESYPVLTKDDIREVLRYAAQALKDEVITPIESSRGPTP
jgi:uncharacterized protein (DUF433 family)